MKHAFLYVTLVCVLATNTLSQVKGRRGNTQKPAPAPAQIATANNAEGSLTFGKQSAKIKHAYARRVTNANDKTKQDVLILLTDRPIPQTYLQDSESADAKLMILYDKSKKGLVRALQLRINWEKRIPSFMLYLGDIPLSSGGGEFRPVTFTPGLVQGNASKKDKFFDDAYEFNVSFKVALRPDGWTGDFVLPTPTNLDLGRASGQLVINSKATPLNHVYARTEYNYFDEKKDRTILLFTEKPVPEESILGIGADRFRKMMQAGNRYVAEYEVSNEEGIAGTIDIWEVGKLSSQASSISAEPIFRPELDLLKSDGRVIEGRLYTEAPEKFFDRTSEFDVAFHAPVKGNSLKAPVMAKNGTPLPAGGGAPGRAFLEMEKALAAAKTAREMVKVMQGSFAAHFIEEEMQPAPDAGPASKEVEASVFELLKFGVIEAPRVTGGFISGDKATIEAVGLQRVLLGSDPAKKERVKARFNMHLEKGQWKCGYGQIVVDK